MTVAACLLALAHACTACQGWKEKRTSAQLSILYLQLGLNRDFRDGIVYLIVNALCLYS